MNVSRAMCEVALTEAWRSWRRLHACACACSCIHVHMHVHVHVHVLTGAEVSCHLADLSARGTHHMPLICRESEELQAEVGMAATISEAYTCMDACMGAWACAGMRIHGHVHTWACACMGMRMHGHARMCTCACASMGMLHAYTCMRGTPPPKCHVASASCRERRT